MFVISGCTDKLKQTSEEKFVGLWEVSGRRMFEGIQIEIKKEDGKLMGRIFKLNKNKLVNLFADSSDVWVSDIKRLSNFEFRITEKKIARDLFSMYGLSTSQDFSAEFIDDNTIGISAESADPLKSKMIYKRISKSMPDSTSTKNLEYN